MSAWKACDIRGEYPGEVCAELFHEIGGHIGESAGRANAPWWREISGTARRETKQALIDGAVKAGARVIDAGQIPTPVAYFAYRRLGVAAVLIVTASHDPAGDNGLKFMLGRMPPTEEEIVALRESLRTPFEVSGNGSVERLDPVPEYLQWLRERWARLAQPPPLRVVLDAGNGVWSKLAPEIYWQLGFRVHPLFCRIDARFPSRPPDCARPANLSALSDCVCRVGADLGIAWDGDGDRVAFVNAHGRVVSSDTVSLLLTRALVPAGSGERVVCDIKLSDCVRRAVLAVGGVPLTERSGHTFLKRRMIQENCLLGCEVSGHYFYRELGGADDAMFSSLLMADLIRRKGPLHLLEAALPKLFVTPDLRVPEERVPYEVIVERLREALRPAQETDLDGVRLENGDGFVLTRKSVTEPVVTLRLEGLDEASFERLLRRCSEALPELAPEFEQCLLAKEA